jgi:kynurenine formamidase
MEFVDLSREIFHRTHRHPSHPPVIMTVWTDHSEKIVAGATTFSSKALSISFSDHAGTHVDAPVHFDPRPEAASIDQVPLANFYTSAFCLDLSHVPLKHAVTVPEMQASLEKSGQEIRPRDTVLIWLGRTNDCLESPNMSTILRAWRSNQCTGSPIKALACSALRPSAPHRKVN